MPLDAQGRWYPNLAPKQLEIFNNYHKFTLVTGPVKSLKTIGCCHRVLRHAFETPMARIAIFAKTTKSAFAGGVWSDILDTVLPEWVEANIGMTLATGTKNAPQDLIEGSTRLRYFDVTNIHGGKSRVQLHSLDYDMDVEANLKSGRFSMFYFSEVTNFRNRIVFDTATERLRMPHLRSDQHLFLCDCNPDDTGTDFWAYRLFYTERLATNHPFPEQQKKFRVIECSLDDNIYLSKDDRDEIFSRYAHDKNRLDRYYYGRWTRATESGLFSDVFNHDTHVLGNCNAMDEDDWELLLPSENVSKMLTGWDPGSSKNHSMHFLEKTGNVFHVLDEVVSLGINLTTADFTDVVMMRLEYWKAFIRDCCHTNPVEWRHWSDSSAFETFRAGGGALGNYDHNIIAMQSNGEIMLSAAPKGKGSIFKRIDIVRRLLFQNRLFVSARCVKTIEMLGGICKGKSSVELVEDSPLRHIFDSLSYALGAECFWEINEEWSPRVAPAGNLISVKL